MYLPYFITHKLVHISNLSSTYFNGNIHFNTIFKLNELAKNLKKIYKTQKNSIKRELITRFLVLGLVRNAIRYLNNKKINLTKI